MGSLFLTGSSSKICQELMKLLPDETFLCNLQDFADPITYYVEADRMVLAHSVMLEEDILAASDQAVHEALNVNCLSILKLCEHALRRNPKVRICILGSESAIKWSYDFPYAIAKTALHKYVEERRLEPLQQLVCVAPSLVEDSHYTVGRLDQHNVREKIRSNPKRRGVSSAEVARMVKTLLYEQEFVNNCVVTMNGGSYARWHCPEKPILMGDKNVR